MEFIAIETSSLPPKTGRECMECELIDRARCGDREAFGELVRRHRAQALGWAGTLTQDSFLAEDIVQEALIRAFLHLGTLSEAGRFKAWLHRIVRNQAYMKLRRGGPFAKERPFTSMGYTKQPSTDTGKDSKTVDWGDIDSILFHLTDYASEEAKRRHHPEECLIRKEMLQSIHMMINCLNKRERAIFEARFFGDLPPSEIASLFNTTTANVYNSLSRSRTKLQKERIRVTIQSYVQRRMELGLPRRKILPPPSL
ncbi:MAG: sigma-70 family polymerase sigma factor [Paenibacillus sp.]|jgi:RNA polymerase sigma factor (sigma-70 family)|nr:sigma-70 family polymerase sigma factor [Paenibacillus sp.]